MIRRISVQFQKLKYIHHLADIHIRNLKRHKEYCQVFVNLYKQIKKQTDNSLIYVGGDICHAKTEMSPELIEMTSKFLSSLADLLPTIVIAGNHDCFTGEHEILTTEGWLSLKKYVEYKLPYSVATFNETTSEIEFQKPYKYIKQYFDGDLFIFKGNDIDAEVTPTHNMLYQFSQYPNKFYKKKAKNFPKRALVPINGIVKDFKNDLFANLLGFSFANGTFVLKNQNTGACRIQFHLKKEREINYLSNILNNLGYKFNIRDGDKKRGTKIICIYSDLAKQIYSFFNGKKTIPDNIFSNNKNFLKSFLIGYLNGDGSKRTDKKSFWSFCNIDQHNVEILSTIVRIVGGGSHISDKIMYGNYERSKRQYHGTLNLNDKVNRTNIKTISRKSFRNYVYCVSVKNENLLIRHNKKIFICGNCNLNNPNRLDALTPIIDNLKHPNLHYLKSGGIYRLADVSLVVMSILDSPDKYKNAVDVDGDYKIALYHGLVHNSFTDTGYQLKNNQITTELFDGYDLVLLGDIHKRQFLDPNETIAYPGSLIQQNHGESLKKGYNLVNIPKKKSTFIEVPNEYGYVTLDIDNGVIPSIDDIPMRARLRLRFSETDSADRKTIMASLRKQYPKLADLTYSTANIFSRSHLRNRDVRIDLGDISNPKYQNDLIIDYLNRNFIIDDVTATQIQKLNIELNSQLPTAEVIRNVIWKPKKFEFSNMFSYGENNILDFSKMKGVVGVFAPNAQGKSSILDALSFCHFDKSSRAYKSINVMNTKKKKFTSVSNFEINDRDYFIERKATKNKKGDAPVKVNFYYKGKNGREYSLNGEQRHSTNKNIREYIGTYEDFTLTALSTQRQTTSFIDMKQSDRKDLLAQFLDVKIFDTLFELANNESKKIHTILKEFQKRDFDKELANIENLLEERKDEYDIIKLEKTKLSRIEKRVTKRLLDLTKSLIKIEKISEDIDSLLKKKIKNEEDIETYNIRVIEQEEKYVEVRDEINSLKEDMIKDMVGVDEEYKHYQELIQKRNLIQQEIEKLKIQVKNKLDKLSKLENFQYDPECKYCMDNPFVKEAIEIRENIDKDKLTAKEYVERADIFDEEIQANEHVVEKYKKYREIMSMLMGLEKHSTDVLYNKTCSLRELEKCKNLLQANKIAIDKYYENENAIKHNIKIKLNIEKVQEEYDTTVRQLSIVDDKVMDLHGQIQVYRNQRKNILKSIDEAKNLEEQYVAYQYYMEAIKRDGIPYELISKTIPTIEAEINNILSQITDFGVVLQVDGKNINAFIAYDENNIWPIELVSGFERFVSLIAIRVAFLNISSLPRPNFLAIDEGFGSLDSENINSMYLLFDYLKTQFDFVMVISHLDSLRDMVDDIIEIKKVKGFSQVKYF